MNLVLDLAENYSGQVGGPEFDGEFEPFVVPGGIVRAVENVFKQTADDGRDGMEDLKNALRPLLEFRAKKSDKN